MAKRDVYSFSIESDNKQAKKSFEELRDLAKEVQETSIDLKTDPNGSGNLTKMTKQITDVMNAYAKLQKALSEEHTSKSRNNMGREAIKQVEDTKKEIEKELRTLTRDVQKSFKAYTKVTGKTPSVTMPSYSQNLNEPTQTRQQATAMKDQAKAIKNRTNATLSIGRRALGSGYINHGQASDYRQNITELLGATYQGASKETILSGEKFTPIKGSVRANALDAMEKAREGIRERKGIIEATTKDANIPEGLKKNVIAKNTEEIDDLNSTLKSAQQVIQELNDSVKNISLQSEEFEGANVREKNDRSKPTGRIFERASAIGMAITGAVAYSVGSKYQRGVQATKEQRPMSLDLGYQTGDYDFRGIRRDMMDMGAERGYMGKDMLEFAQTVIGGTGYTDKETLNAMTDNIADFAKFSGAGKEESTQYMENLYRSGAVSTADQAKAIQNGFMGAIKMSGMEGREKEQIQALSQINENLFRGREVTNDEAENRMAMTTILSGTGTKALQGQNLAEFMTSADDAIKGSSPFSDLGMMLGVGTDPRYSGLEGNYNYIVDTQKGFDSENASKLITREMARAGGNTKAAASILYNDLGGNVNVEALESIMSKYPNGIPQEEIDKVVKEANDTKDTGELDTRKEKYNESSDQTRESLEAYQQKMEALLNDNALVDSLKNLEASIKEMGSSSPGAAIGVTAVSGAVAGLVSGLTGVIGTALGTGISNLVSTKMVSPLMAQAGSGGFKGAVGTGLTKMSGWFKGTKGGAGSVAEGVKETVTNTAEATKGATETVSNAAKTTKAASGAGGTTKVVEEALEGGAKNVSKFASMGGKFMKGAAKVAPWLAAGTSIASIATADDKVKETGKQGGAWLGGIGGAKLGATIGTAIAPGIGTAIGGALFGIGGSLMGSKLGGWAIDKAKDGWNWFTGKDDKVEASELDPENPEDQYNNQKNTAQSQEEKSNTTNKKRGENLRADNIKRETDNLKVMDDLLTRIDTLLEKSRAQNGIIGSMNGVPEDSSGGGSSSTAKGLNYTGNSQYWTNTNLTKHDLGTTSNAVTAKELNAWINAKAPKGSNMRNMGDAFIKAGEASGLDPRYLVAHAAHETGWGTSNISKKKGNMYGIGAFDATPYSSAYKYNNTEAGIIEGAKWISDNYYAKGQKTLGSMRHNGGKHEYATDPDWDKKIAGIMKGAESYTSPSTVNVTTNVNVSSTGNASNDGKAIARAVNTNVKNNMSAIIGKDYVKEMKRR